MSAPICKRFIRIYVASYLHVHVQVHLHVYAIHVDFFSAARRRRSFDDANKSSQHRKPGKQQQQGHQQRGGSGDHVVNKPRKRDYQGQPKSNGQRNDKSADGAQQQHQQKKYR